MTLLVVVLRDLDGSLHIIPNGEIKVVSNKTRGWSRAVVDISVPHTEDLERALTIVRDEAARILDRPNGGAFNSTVPSKCLEWSPLPITPSVIRTLPEPSQGRSGRWAVSSAAGSRTGSRAR